MKKHFINILNAIFTIIESIYWIFRRLYFNFSRYILKPYFDVETPIYRKWHDRRAKRIQALIDQEHSKYAPV